MLRGKQQRFVEEYLIDLNATQAAIRSGYSEKTAVSIGAENLRKPQIQEAISSAQKERSDRTEITQDRVLLEIARLAFNDPRKAFDENGALLPVQQWPDEVAAAISSIKTTEMRDSDGTVIGDTKEIKFWDKGKHLDMAGRHLNIFTDTLNVKSNVTLMLSPTEMKL